MVDLATTSPDTQLLRDILKELRQANTFDLTRQNLTQTMTVTLAAGETRPFFTSFRSFTVLTLTGDTTGVFMTMSQGSGQATNPIFAGMKASTPAQGLFVDSFTLYNSNAGAVTVSFMLGFMDIEDSRLNLTGSVSVINASNNALGVYSGTNCASVAPVTVTTAGQVLFNSNGLRRRAWVQSLSTNTVPAFITGGVASLANGLELLPSQTFCFDTAGTISAITASGTAQIRLLGENN